MIVNFGRDKDTRRPLKVGQPNLSNKAARHVGS
jgi:hypothetical protein